MKKKVIILSAVAALAGGSLAVLAAGRAGTSWLARGDGEDWNHYQAVAPTCASFGIKEYWTDCKGTTTIEQPTGVNFVEMGQPSAADIQYIVDTYGESDERIIAKTEDHVHSEDPNCLGKDICSVCGETLGGVVPTIDFVNNGIYGMYDWYKGFGAPDASWVTTPSATSIQYLTYNPGYVSEIRLPNIYYAGFSTVTIDLAITYQNEIYSFEEDKSVAFTVPSNSFAAKLVFSDISASSMTASLRDSSGNILISKVVTDANVLNGLDGFKYYAEGVYTGVGYEVLSNFTFIDSCEHDFVVDPNCIGKEVCSVCGEARGIANPTFDFTQNLYGASTGYEPWGSTAENGWVRADNAGSVSFVSYQDGAISDYHLPRIYFAGFTSLTIDVVVNQNLVTYALDHDFTSYFQVSFAGYSLKVVFEDISASGMTVKIQDAFGMTQVQSTCSDADILNGLENFTLFVKGSGPVGWDAFSNFTFTA